MTRILIVLLILCPAWQRDCYSQDAARSGEEATVENGGQVGPDLEKKRDKKRKKARNRPVLPDVRDVRAGLVGEERERNGVYFYEYSSFRIGVTELDVPAWRGWIDIAGNEKIYEQFSGRGQPHERLECIIIRTPKGKRTSAKEITDFYCLVWVPEAYEFKLFSESSFEGIKQELREEILAERKENAKRENFDTFEAYMNYKFGRDDQVADAADRSRIEIASEGDLITHFHTDVIQLRLKEGVVDRPQIVTSTLAIVRNKLVRIEVRRYYGNDDDITHLLDFGERFVDDFRRVNAVKR